MSAAENIYPSPDLSDFTKKKLFSLYSFSPRRKIHCKTTFYSPIYNFFFRESCDKQICQNEVSKLFNYMMSKPILSDIVDMLKNSQFCQDAEKIHLNSGQILSCQEFVPTFIPMALEVLFTLEKSEIANICNLVFGVC